MGLFAFIIIGSLGTRFLIGLIFTENAHFIMIIESGRMTNIANTENATVEMDAAILLPEKQYFTF